MSQDIPGAEWLEPLASLTGTAFSFIVTIRPNPGNPHDHSAGWHGSVEHCQTGERIFFMDYARLNAFIAARSETVALLPWRTRLLRRWQQTGLHQYMGLRAAPLQKERSPK